jgi:Excreted virulence factor EspC, type VII ESX diderm
VADQVHVVTEALRKEAHKWDDLYDQMTTVNQSIKGLSLSIGAFFIGSAADGVHHDAYEGYRDFVDGVTSEAPTQFNGLAYVLREIAGFYDETDKIAEMNLDKLYDGQKPTGD